MLIGRHPECDVRLELPAISRRHCLVALAYDRITIRDLGSRHGLLLNGQPCEEALLSPGDELAIGPLLYRFEDDPPDPPKPPPEATAKRPSPPSLPEIDPDGDLVPLSELFLLE